MADSLSIWMDGIRVAEVERLKGGRLRLSYTEEALDHYELGVPLLSLRLPLVATPYSHGVVRRFLEGLLPEGPARRTVAEHFDLKVSDTYALIRELGRDCAGALVVLRTGQPLPPQRPVQAATPLSEAELAELVTRLSTAPFGVDENFRISLAGVQQKLVLTRLPNGSWAKSDAGLPSTHILKPEIPELSTKFSTVDNEAFCMRFARYLNLPVAAVETAVVNERRMIVVQRYDRIMEADGTVRRVHQEDFCQALSILPGEKYEEDGGPSLRMVARILNDYKGVAAMEALLRAVTVNVLIQNGDAHGKNFSVLHESPGVIRLAPLYDLMSTRIYGVKKLAMRIDGIELLERVSSDRVINEALSWGMRRQRAKEIVADLLKRTGVAADAAASETPGSEIVRTVVRKQTLDLQKSLEQI